MRKTITKIIKGIKVNFLIIILILIGIIIRLLLINIAGFKFDVDDWFAWSNRLNEVGYSNFYNPQVFSDYTPGYLYILHFLGFIKSLLHLDTNIFYILLKLPAIFADLILSIFIYKQLTRNKNKLYSYLGVLIFILNPAFIFNSTVWGQIDSIPTLFMFLSIIYFHGRKLILSSLLLGLAFLIKPQSFALLPIFILFLIKNSSIKNYLKLTIPFFLTTTILSFPFFSNAPFVGLWILIQKSVSQYPFNSLFAYNIWGIFGFWLPDKFFYLWGYILLGGYWLIIGSFYLKKRLSVFSLAAFTTLSFFILLTRMHERYLYPGLFFLIFTAAVYKNKLLLTFSLILSAFHFLNLYYVYVYYNELYLKLPKLLYNPLLYNLLDANGKILSLLSTIIFILVSISLLKIDYAKKT